MMRLKVLIALMVGVLLSGCGTMGRAPEYAGADAGFLVVAIGQGIDTQYSSYKLFYRSKIDSNISGAIYFNSGGFIGPPTLDFKGEENGVVLTKKLPPGEYELTNFEIFSNGANLAPSVWWQSKENFSIPFKISAGTATYVGDFKAVGLLFRSFFGMKRALGGAYFVVTDKSERDIPIAKQKTASIEKVEVNVLNVDLLNNPLLRTKESPPVMED